MDVNAIFDAVGKAGAYICLQDQRDKKAEQLRSVQVRRCGNCWHWMKSTCVPEKKHEQFKTCNSMACNDFDLTNSGGLITKFEGELKELEDRIATFPITGELKNEQET